MQSQELVGSEEVDERFKAVCLTEVELEDQYLQPTGLISKARVGCRLSQGHRMSHGDTAGSAWAYQTNPASSLFP